jgi:hypothetical protein
VGRDFHLNYLFIMGAKDEKTRNKRGTTLVGAAMIASAVQAIANFTQSFSTANTGSTADTFHPISPDSAADVTRLNRDGMNGLTCIEGKGDNTSDEGNGVPKDGGNCDGNRESIVIHI